MYKSKYTGLVGNGVPIGFTKGTDCAPLLWLLAAWLYLTDPGNAMLDHIIIWCQSFHLEPKEVGTLFGMGFILHLIITYKK